MNILKKISNDQIFKSEPIIIIHIGSAGSNFNNLREIASNSILISIDGSTDLNKNKRNFLKVLNKNVIISDKNENANFYVTKDPHCSSLLLPEKKIYKYWYGAHRFKIKKKIKCKVVNFNDFLKTNKIRYIDWLVIDAQGMDLKILKSIKETTLKTINIIDIEPGFELFYKDADKIENIFSFMRRFFDFADIKFGYNYKVKSKRLNYIEKKILFLQNEPSKIYANINFLNKSKKKRSLLLKIIYLIQNNKIFEARELILNQLKNDKSLNEIKKLINKEILKKKFIFAFFFPFYYLKKLIIKCL